MTEHQENLPRTDHLPPPIEQPNAYPFNWYDEDPKLAKLYGRAKQEHWDPASNDWDSIKPNDYEAIQRSAILYWWAVLTNFENNAAVAFSKALV